MFKVGDKVRIAEGKNAAIGNGDRTEVYTVKKIDPRTKKLTFIETEGTQNAGAWTADRFELVEEKKMKYKIGKKYVHKLYPGEYVYKCVYVHDTGAGLVERNTDKLLFVLDTNTDLWEEVKEKIVVTKYVHWYKWKDGNDVWTVTNNSPMGKLSPNEKHIKTDVITCEVEKL